MKKWAGLDHHYWPMAGSGGTDQPGAPGSHLWAKEGPLAKLDSLLTARGHEATAKALEFGEAGIELVDTLSGKGHYIANKKLTNRTLSGRPVILTVMVKLKDIQVDFWSRRRFRCRWFSNNSNPKRESMVN